MTSVCIQTHSHFATTYVKYETHNVASKSIHIIIQGSVYGVLHCSRLGHQERKWTDEEKETV